MSKILKIASLSLLIPMLSVGAHASTSTKNDDVKAVGKYQVKEDQSQYKTSTYTIDTYVNGTIHTHLDSLKDIKTNPDWQLVDSKSVQLLETPLNKTQISNVSQRGYIDTVRETKDGSIILSPQITDEGSSFYVEYLSPNVVSVSYTFDQLLGKVDGFDTYTTKTANNELTTQIVNKASFRLSNVLNIKPHQTLVSYSKDSKGRNIVTAITRE
jgi:hypothetical protein